MEDSGLNVNEYNELKPRCATGKLVLGILSIVLSMVVMLQSCAAGVSNALLDNGETSGTTGFLVALNLLITGIIAIAARKSVSKVPWIIATVLLWLNYFYGKVLSESYSDLVIWGFLSYAVGVFYLLTSMRSKKGLIISIVVSAIYLIVALV